MTALIGNYKKLELQNSVKLSDHHLLCQILLNTIN